MAKILMGEVLRYGRPYNPKHEFLGTQRNFFYAVARPTSTLPLLEKGINPIKKLRNGRVPAVLISSSPHKVGSEVTPWQDFFNPDKGHIRYFGDNKAAGREPSEARGNAALLAQFDLHQSSSREMRLKASPLLFFQRVAVNGKRKGHVRFQGYGVIERVDRLVQFDIKAGTTFPNFGFDFAVLSLFDEEDQIDWSWINDRRDSSISDEDCLKRAPTSWRTWVNEGQSALSKCRRRVSKTLTVKSHEQKPVPGSREERVLAQIYQFYRRKHRFEGLAEFVSQQVLAANGNYVRGWITPGSGDGGTDFVARLDLGSELACAKVIILGQAKCESPDSPTSGRDLARTVARLRRGWIGVYVTTSYFSERAQQEVIEDKYPLVLINGLRLAQEVEAARIKRGYTDALALLKTLDDEFDARVANRDPEEILFATSADLMGVESNASSTRARA